MKTWKSIRNENYMCSNLKFYYVKQSFFLTFVNLKYYIYTIRNENMKIYQEVNTRKNNYQLVSTDPILIKVKWNYWEGWFKYLKQ
jgi:hypothetical protein